MVYTKTVHEMHTERYVTVLSIGGRNKTLFNSHSVNIIVVRDHMPEHYCSYFDNNKVYISYMVSR